MSKRLLLVTVVLIIAGLVTPSSVVAQAREFTGDEAVVRAVLFYSPTCPHCHEVITELLVPMMEEYGEQLEIAGIDTSQSGGAQLYQSAIQWYQVPDERRGVPTLVVGEVVLVGGVEIPDRFPGIVEEGLASGGIGWPDFPGLTEAMAQAGEDSTPVPIPAATESLPTTTTAQPEADDGRCRVGEEYCGEAEGTARAETDTLGTSGQPLSPTGTPASLTKAADSRAEKAVHLVFFWSETCPHCHEVMANHLPPLVERYGDRLEIASIETSTNPDHYEIYLAAIELFGIPPERQGVPAIFIGDTHLVGSTEISNQLEGLIQTYLDRGGVDYPPIPGLEGITGQPTQTELEPTATQAEATQPGEVEPSGDEAQPIYLAYFYQTGCQDCDRVKGDLNYLKSKFPQLIVEEYNVRDNAELSEWLGERNGVPELHRLTAPTVFVEDDYLLEGDLDARSLEALLEKHTPDGAGRVWENWEEKAGETAQQGIVERFRSLGVFTVVLAGLVDGLNPCAFATLVFFVSYLTISGRKGMEVLSVGAAFTFGVFLAYILVGMGLYRALDLLGDTLTALGRWLYGLTAAFCLVLAVISFFDYLKARRGEIGDMALNLPHRLRMQINATIRKTRKSHAFVAAAFMTGIIVSFLELACTGQVYLPTIIFVMSVPELKAQAALFLLLYNLLFVAPLVVVFVLAYYGTGAKQFSNFLQERASTVKLGMSFLFLMLGGWLAVSLV
jgi:cytochrome c biogenesis protein CcdA/thiol-disulfide isomerase/thioredoxin